MSRPRVNFNTWDYPKPQDHPEFTESKSGATVLCGDWSAFNEGEEPHGDKWKERYKRERKVASVTDQDIVAAWKYVHSHSDYMGSDFGTECMEVKDYLMGQGYGVSVFRTTSGSRLLLLRRSTLPSLQCRGMMRAFLSNG